MVHMAYRVPFAAFRLKKKKKNTVITYCTTRMLRNAAMPGPLTPHTQPGWEKGLYV
jgi:hypothetical protein